MAILKASLKQTSGHNFENKIFQPGNIKVCRCKRQFCYIAGVSFKPPTSFNTIFRNNLRIGCSLCLSMLHRLRRLNNTLCIVLWKILSFPIFLTGFLRILNKLFLTVNGNKWRSRGVVKPIQITSRCLSVTGFLPSVSGGSYSCTLVDGECGGELKADGRYIPERKFQIKWVEYLLLTLNQECQNLKSKKNPKFHFVKYWKTNGTMQKYCWRVFIWMVTP